LVLDCDIIKKIRKLTYLFVDRVKIFCHNDPTELDLKFINKFVDDKSQTKMDKFLS